MKGLDKLFLAHKMLLEELISEIKDEKIDDERPFLEITFFNGLLLYIRYNDYNEYSYQLIYSQDYLDRIRYDNFDDRWEVKSKPHYFHPQGRE